MCEWTLTNTDIKNVQDKNDKSNSRTDYAGAVLYSENRVSGLIMSLLEVVENEITTLWENREDYLEKIPMLESAYLWLVKDVPKLKKSLFDMVPAILNKKSLPVFEKSMERLQSHLTRKQAFCNQGGELEFYLEWLLELPYLIKERLESASLLASTT